MLLCSPTTETFHHNPAPWCRGQAEHAQMHGLQELQELQAHHHQSAMVDGPGEGEQQKKVLLGTRLRSRFPFAQKLLIKPENAQPSLLLTQPQSQKLQQQQHAAHTQTPNQPPQSTQCTTTLRAPWMTSRRRYNPDKKTPLSPLLSQLIQRLYYLNSHFHCFCEHNGRATEPGQGKAKVRVKDKGGGGALEVYGLSKSLLFSDRIENGSDLNLADDGWVDASGTNGDGVGSGTIFNDDEGAFGDHDDEVDEDDGAHTDETLLDWDPKSYSTASDREDTDHTMYPLHLERPYAWNLNTNAMNIGDDFAHTTLTQGSMSFNDNLITTAPITTWPLSDPDDLNPNHATSHPPSVEQAFADMTTIPSSSSQLPTSDTSNEDELLFLPPPTPRPRLIELLDTDIGIGTDSMNTDTGLKLLAETEVDHDAFDSNADGSDPTPSIRAPVSASVSPSASSSDSFLTPSEPFSHHTILPASLDYNSTPAWVMDQDIQQHNDSSHDRPESYKHQPPNDEVSSYTLGSDAQDKDDDDLTSRPRTAHGLSHVLSFSLVTPKHVKDGEDDVTNGRGHASANKEEPLEAPREVVEEDLNSGKGNEHDTDAIYLYDPFDLVSDPRTNSRGGSRDDMESLPPKQSLSSSTLASPSTSPSISTSLSLSTSSFTSLSSPTNSPLFPPGLPRPPPRDRSPSSSSKRQKLKPTSSSYALSEKSQWKLAVAQYHHALSTRGMRHPGFPPSPLGPNWERYYGRV